MTKPDPTGQRFGFLVVLGKGEKRQHPSRNVLEQLWLLQCDCGNTVLKPKHKFLSGGHVSCGCARKLGLVDTGIRRTDLTGRRWGDLVAIKLTNNVLHCKRTWLFQCDCGNTRELSYSTLKMLEYGCIRINCGDKKKHPDNNKHYPPTPSPYPTEAGELLVKYLKETEVPYSKVNSEVEDQKRDDLIRACWIITWRRQVLNEVISEKFERGIIKKYMKYAAVTVKKKRRFETRDYVYNNKNRKKIGSTMTELTSNTYPVIQTQENNSRATQNAVSEASFRRTPSSEKSRFGMTESSQKNRAGEQRKNKKLKFLRF